MGRVVRVGLHFAATSSKVRPGQSLLFIIQFIIIFFVGNIII